jgi:hypothetical protein
MKQKVKMALVGLNGNAYAIMGAFKHAARQQGWTAEEIKTVLDEATSGDYDHLLATIIDNVVDSEDEDEDAEEQERRDEKHGLYGELEDVAN